MWGKLISSLLVTKMLVIKWERHSVVYLIGCLLVTAFSGKNILNSNKDHSAVHRKQDSDDVTPTAWYFLGHSYSLHYIRVILIALPLSFLDKWWGRQNITFWNLSELVTSGREIHSQLNPLTQHCGWQAVVDNTRRSGIAAINIAWNATER